MDAGGPARADVYTDFGGIASLRREAGENPTAALEEVARQFEAMFLQEVLKQSRAGSLGDDLLGGDSLDRYTEMFHQQLALEMASGEGAGLREVLVRQLAAQPGVVPFAAPVGEVVDASAGTARTPLERLRFEGRDEGPRDD
jgi:flagellar protein FlgJ